MDGPGLDVEKSVLTPKRIESTNTGIGDSACSQYGTKRVVR